MLNGWPVAGWATAAGAGLGQYVERESRVEHQAARQNPHEPASLTPPERHRPVLSSACFCFLCTVPNTVEISRKAHHARLIRHTLIIR